MSNNGEHGTKTNPFLLNVSFDVQLTKEDIDDIMCAALEDGICYWCGRAEVVGEYLAEHGHEQISRGGMLRLHDLEDGKVYELTRDNFMEGLRLFLQHGNSDLVNIKNHRIDSSEFDSECADCVVQYAIFGEIVYS